MEFLFVANWKMHKTRSEARQFISEFCALGPLPELAGANSVKAVICPPYTAIDVVSEGIGGVSNLCLGAQNIHWEEKGAHTGEVAPGMLTELGVEFAIVGHSERYQYYGESPEQVALRAISAIRKDIRPIICVGEQKSDYESGRSQQVVLSQLEASLTEITKDVFNRVIIAYEPVWAIGTGLAASGETAQKMHASIRELLVGKFGSGAREIPILYGGSTSPDNISEFMQEPDIAGALIGGASLDPARYRSLIDRGFEVANKR